jgi:subtilisin-like proprotein convertase family protein
VESVALEVGFSHASRGQVEITLTSPSGTVSQLSTQRPFDTAAGLFWKYTSVRHWGESATGTWTVTVTDKLAGTTGTLNTAILWLYGSASTTTSAPVINSSLSAGATQNSAFNYQILALNSPTGFSATGLPAGLSINPQTGLLSGTPTVAGTFNITLGATNAVGTTKRSSYRL